MYFVIDILCLVFLIWAFRAVRGRRIVSEIERTMKRTTVQSSVRTSRAADNWSRAPSRDVRVRYGKRMDDAPSYTSYNSNK